MADRFEVESFLEEFRWKMEIYDIVFRSRANAKNEETLAILDITPAYRRYVIAGLGVADYSEGPIKDELYHGTDMWVFGKLVKGREVYIKISMGRPGCRTICISFHLSEYPMRYPYGI